MKPYDARQVANWFIRRAARDGEVLFIMSMLKLVYIAHGHYLARKGKPLVANKIEAWRYGPVIVGVYEDFHKQGLRISRTLEGLAEIDEPSDVEVLEEVWKKYGGFRPFQLSKLTHVRNGPWHLATQIGGWYAPIPPALIKQHYDARERQHV